MTTFTTPLEIEHHTIATNGINLHVAQAGPMDGPLVILLHGFPEFWHGWMNQIEALVAEGYRVWAPDQRGYNLSDKPQGIESYTLDVLVDDIAGLIQSSGHAQVDMVGHDWGAIVLWRLSERYPELIRRQVIMNVPHPAVMMDFLKSHAKQMMKSAYVFFFQIPDLPEKILASKDWKRLTGMLQQSANEGAFSEEELDLYREAWSQPGADTAMLNWYRALMQKRPEISDTAMITVPTRMIWGSNDQALSKEMSDLSIRKCENGELIHLDHCTHWLHHEDPTRVNTLILQHLKYD
ncbi:MULTISPECIES: alpha/beta fold hydrolase [Paenibacillus]|uniref:alpha/beta fold hydrolase n=1 Tax=Paenibacillus TaxID=44249 RepID=UPI000364AA1E|nr:MULTISPECIES: alpha/beta hydrolase [Paenibacillus]